MALAAVRSAVEGVDLAAAAMGPEEGWAAGEEAPAWIAQTQQTLGSVVQKPKLTDNLLKKPPFRFLHDVVSATTKVSVLACPSQLLAYPSQLRPLWAISVSVCLSGSLSLALSLLAAISVGGLSL